MLRFQKWLRNIGIQDPIEREQAVMLQIMMIGLGIAAVLVIPLEFAVLSTYDAIRTATTSIVTITTLIIAMWILRKDYLRLAVLTISILMILSYAVNLFLVGITKGGGLLFSFVMPITISGLLTGRKGILIITGLNICIVGVIGLIEGTTTGIIGLQARENQLVISIATFIMASLVAAFLFYHFSATLRQSLDRTLKSEEKYRSIFENASEGIFQSTLAGTFLSANPALARIYGYESPAALIDSVADIGRELYVDPARRADLLASINKNAIVTEFESEVYRKDGALIWISENIRAVRDGDGRLLYYEGRVSDITRRKQADAELARHREQLEELVEQRTEALTMTNTQLAQLATELRAKNESFRQGLALAHAIQLGLLPQRPPWNPVDAVAVGASFPAAEVGGDFYTYIGFREDPLIGVVIGDISGKGIGAALMMALVLSAVESLVREARQPQALLPLLNHNLLSHLKNNQMNAGLQYVLIDLDRQVLRVANAGMVAPFLIRAGSVQPIDVYGLPIGALAAPAYQEVEIQIQPEDLIVLVSDGIVEAHNGSGELFGFDRLEEVLRSHAAPHDPSRLVSELMDATRAFTGSREQHDDMTVVAILPYPALAHGAS